MRIEGFAPYDVPLEAAENVPEASQSPAADAQWRARAGSRDAGGRFIAFEGGEGVGKSTQSSCSPRRSKRREIEVVLTREPGGRPAPRRSARYCCIRRDEGWNARAEALLFAAARADHVETDPAGARSRANG